MADKANALLTFESDGERWIAACIIGPMMREGSDPMHIKMFSAENIKGLDFRLVDIRAIEY